MQDIAEAPHSPHGERLTDRLRDAVSEEIRATEARVLARLQAGEEAVWATIAALERTVDELTMRATR